jgi:predicted permease
VHADFNVVASGYFETLGVKLLRGRDFAAADRTGTPPVAVVSRAFADRYWPGQDAVGKLLRDVGPMHAPFVIVGVVADLKLRQLSEEARPVVYVSLEQWYMPRMTLVVRSRLETRETIASLRTAVARVDPELPLFRVRTLADQIQASISRERLLAGLFTGFGGLGLALSWAGLYGLVSFVTASRTREIGVRMALGAEAADVFRLVAGQSLRPTMLGLAIGLVAAVAGARLLSGLLYGVEPVDLPTLAAVAVLALLAGGAAGHWPARRAVRIEPSTALRRE